jgi:oxygen-independent coproporphyrinogen III oxidase
VTPSPDELTRLGAKYDVGNQPGYLSYPAVSHWSQPIGDGEVLDIVGATADDAYLYFHFPYCETLCYYCACYMAVTANPKERYDAYVTAILAELDLKLAARGRPLVVGEMHWGGGTPTYMSCAQIERVFAGIERRVRWSARPTLSLEAYPDERTLSDEKLELLRALGFSQIGFGVESLDPRVLAAINRRHDRSSVERWVNKARALGFGVHVDVVYGLPYQSEESLRETMQALIEIAPDRLAAFFFMYTPSSIKHQQLIAPASVPRSAERARLYATLAELAERDYTRVGCDHWVRSAADPLSAAAKSGSLIYHFQGYEPLSRETFLGFGSAAISFARDRYFQNLPQVDDYVAAIGEGRLAVAADRSLHLDADDKLRHHVIMKQIMSDLRIDKDAVEARHAVVFDERFAGELVHLRKLQADGLVSGVDERCIDVTPLGRAFIRNIARVFDRHRAKHLPLPLVAAT